MPPLLPAPAEGGTPLLLDGTDRLSPEAPGLCAPLDPDKLGCYAQG